MHQPSGDGSSSVRPALLLRYGSKEPKRCHLDRDVLLLGRASTCDIALVSPEVAPLHCVIVRNGNVWRLRDCTGRRGTRVNGKPVQEERLCDGDVVQVGVFSFEVQLPSGASVPDDPAGKPAPALLRQLQHLQRARRRLIRLALRLRRRSRQAGPLPPSLAELEKQAEALRALHRRCQNKLHELEKAEAELCQERRAFEAVCAEQRAYLEQAARHLEERYQAAAEAAAPPALPQRGSGLSQAVGHDTVADNVPRSVYVERDEAREQAVIAQEEVARLAQELEHSKLLLHQREAELTAMQAEATLSRATAQATGHQSHLANLRRIREQLAQKCPEDALPC